jgi:hypothetical protein
MNFPDTYEAEPDDETFLALVASGRVVRFGHREHLRLAQLSARRSAAVDEVVARCRSGILAVAEARGAKAHYHATITTAWAAIMLDAARALPAADIDGLLAARPELLDPRHLEHWYSPALLGSDAARLRALEPDRAPLPG